jgi:hypothetical protein
VGRRRQIRPGMDGELNKTVKTTLKKRDCDTSLSRAKIGIHIIKLRQQIPLEKCFSLHFLCFIFNFKKITPDVLP